MLIQKQIPEIPIHIAKKKIFNYGLPPNIFKIAKGIPLKIPITIEIKMA